MNIKYTFKRWLKYVAIIKKSVSFTKSSLGPPFATYFSNFFLTNILVPDKRNDSKYLRRWGGDANNPNYNSSIIHIQSAFCQNRNISAFKT